MSNSILLAMNGAGIFFNIFMALDTKSPVVKLGCCIAIFCFLASSILRIEKMIAKKPGPAEVRK